MIRYLLILVILGLFQCNGNHRNSTNDETIIFRTSEHNLIFSLKIDSQFNYYDSFLNKDIILGYPIGKYKKHKDSSLIYLRINERDTTFKYPLYLADSVLFGLTEKRYFNIVNNHNKLAWVID